MQRVETSASFEETSVEEDLSEDLVELRYSSFITLKLLACVFTRARNELHSIPDVQACTL